MSVLTEEFRDAFTKQCRAIGFDGASLYTPHPIQNKTTAELHAFAGESFNAILALITSQLEIKAA